MGAVGIQVVFIEPARRVGMRAHNRATREALAWTLRQWKRKKLMGHFERSAHGKYGYKKRQQKYIRSKVRRYGSGVDLVKTGATQLFMRHTRGRITYRGSASRGTLTGMLHLKFPSTVAITEDPAKGGVTGEDMKQEVTALIQSELTGMMRMFLDKYEKRIAVLAPRGRRRQTTVAAI